MVVQEHRHDGEQHQAEHRAYPPTRYVDNLAALTVQLNDPAEPHAAVCRDPRHDYLVALAQSSGAEAVVTGDLDLLAIDPGELEIQILTPRLLVERLAAS